MILLIEYKIIFRDDEFVTKATGELGGSVKAFNIILHSNEYSGPEIRKFLEKTVGRKMMKGARVIKNKYNDIRVTCSNTAQFIQVNEKLKELRDYYKKKADLLERIHLLKHPYVTL